MQTCSCEREGGGRERGRRERERGREERREREQCSGGADLYAQIGAAPPPVNTSASHQGDKKSSGSSRTVGLTSRRRSLTGGRHFIRDVLEVNMEFSFPPVPDTLPSLRRAHGPPSTRWLVSSRRRPRRQVSGSGPPETRGAAVETPQPAGSAAAGQRCTWQGR